MKQVALVFFGLLTIISAVCLYNSTFSTHSSVDPFNSVLQVNKSTSFEFEVYFGGCFDVIVQPIRLNSVGESQEKIEVYRVGIFSNERIYSGYINGSNSRIGQFCAKAGEDVELLILFNSPPKSFKSCRVIVENVIGSAEKELYLEHELQPIFQKIFGVVCIVSTSIFILVLLIGLIKRTH